MNILRPRRRLLERSGNGSLDLFGNNNNAGGDGQNINNDNLDNDDETSSGGGGGSLKHHHTRRPIYLRSTNGSIDLFRTQKDTKATKSLVPKHLCRPSVPRSKGSLHLFRGKKMDKNESNSDDSDDDASQQQQPKQQSTTTPFRVTVPDHIQPGEVFQAKAEGRIFAVRCPPNGKGGMSLQISLPPPLGEQENGGINKTESAGDCSETFTMSSSASTSTSTESSRPSTPEQPLSTHKAGDSPNVTRITTSAGLASYSVAVPDGVEPGTQFPVRVSGQEFLVTCPAHARPGCCVTVIPPPLSPQEIRELRRQEQQRLEEEERRRRQSATAQMQQQMRREREQEEARRRAAAALSDAPREAGGAGGTSGKLFEVTVPQYAVPGEPFSILAAGSRVLVVCPPDANPGQRIRFKMPLDFVLGLSPGGQNGDDGANHPQTEAAAIKLSYDKDGWARTVRLSDMKLQWVRMNERGGIENFAQQRFDADKSAYVRKLVVDNKKGSNKRVPTGTLSLVPAGEATMDSSILDSTGDELIGYAEIVRAQGKSFRDKAKWFQEKCALLCVEWNEGHMQMKVRRSHLLQDSVDAVMSLGRKDMRKIWKFVFIGEKGLDAGGLAREWFQLVTEQIFDPARGLWKSSESNQMCMDINPASKFICDDHLVYYRFIGRVMGKALLDGQLVAGHMVQCLYKHLLGWPVTLKDLRGSDPQVYENLNKLRAHVEESGQDLEMLCLNFTSTQEFFGVREEHELIPGGSNVELTNANFADYLEASLKDRMLERVKPQLAEVLLGFYDVIPEPLLAVFDFQELELLMCGLPTVDLDDWRANTEYAGAYEDDGEAHPTCAWFWQVVEEEFDQELRVRLLQFVTATSGVPSRGFGALQGNDGNIRKFTIEGVSKRTCLYPRAHTCFNRIDLPVYESKEELREKLMIAVTIASTGFDLE